MFVDLSDKNIVVVGGGNIATRRVKTLLQFTRNVTAVSAEGDGRASGAGQDRAGESDHAPGKESGFSDGLHGHKPQPTTESDDEIYRVCKEEGIYVNVADDKNKCDFYFPGIYMHDEVVVGITASGLNHKRARKVRVAIQEAMEETDRNDDED